MIETRELSKSFSAPAGEIKVLRGIDLSVASGEMVAVMGSSGVGKSTLLHILGTLDRPTSGSVFYNGAEVSAMSQQELTSFRNSTIGFVFQFHHLLPEFTAVENVMMPSLIAGPPESIVARERASTLLGELGLGQRASHRPGELSGGEQQRVAVARSLILNPAVVLADEPTGNLDTTTGDELFDLLININKVRGTTFVIATHNEALAKRCHRVLQMVDGRITDRS
jgi:lipoprotein-releasing system ATP-binding protein